MTPDGATQLTYVDVFASNGSAYIEFMDDGSICIDATLSLDDLKRIVEIGGQIDET